VARYDFERAAYSLARSGYEQQRDSRKRLLGEEHPDTLTSMNALANTLRDQGDQPGARRLDEAVLEVRKRVLGNEHPDTLTSMNNLAIMMRDQGDLPGARRLEETVLEVGKRVQGEEHHPDTLASMRNLAITLRAQGDLPGARRLEEAMLAVSRRLLGEENLDRLGWMHNLAITLQTRATCLARGGWKRACWRLGSASWARSTRPSMNNLAITLWRQGKSEEARPLQEICVAGYTRTLGANTSAHPECRAGVGANGWRRRVGPCRRADVVAPRGGLAWTAVASNALVPRQEVGGHLRQLVAGSVRSAGGTRIPHSAHPVPIGDGRRTFLHLKAARQAQRVGLGKSPTSRRPLAVAQSAIGRADLLVDHFHVPRVRIDRRSSPGR
jgi:hypothetical protein